MTPSIIAITILKCNKCMMEIPRVHGMGPMYISFSFTGCSLFLGDFSRALFTADDNYTSNPFYLITFRPTALTSAYAVDYNYDNDDIHDNDNDNNGTKW